MRNDPKAVGTLLAAVLTFGCGGPAPAPVAGSSAGFLPDLRGRQVMVFPVQIRMGVPGDATPEIVFALRAKGTEVDWIFPDELEALLARSPVVDSSVRGLQVGIFLAGEVGRIGDPLFGQLRRLGALTGSDMALIPVAGRPGALADFGSVASAVESLVETLLWYIQQERAQIRTG